MTVKDERQDGERIKMSMLTLRTTGQQGNFSVPREIFLM